ncbi:hypothetical protein E2C01_003421 [Portunus trituberculatus]|uniref:Uncharacterized protein n=1 Tax=Portunus trituberculatus TaxID=210409 RepID=A0A5B7CMS2_PORTR|nr:hypothetical protein [Portunus trituberculatus]
MSSNSELRENRHWSPHQCSLCVTVVEVAGEWLCLVPLWCSPVAAMVVVVVVVVIEVLVLRCRRRPSLPPVQPLLPLAPLRCLTATHSLSGLHIE